MALVFGGDLGPDDARRLYDTICSAATDLRVDLGAVTSLDTVAAAALEEGAEALRAQGKRIHWFGLTERHRSTLELVSLPAPHAHAAAASRPRDLEKRPARALLDLAELMGDTWATWVKVPLGRERARLAEVAEQSVRLGVDTLGVVVLLSFLTGVILAFQAAF